MEAEMNGYFLDNNSSFTSGTVNYNYFIDLIQSLKKVAGKKKFILTKLIYNDEKIIEKPLKIESLKDFLNLVQNFNMTKVENILTE